MIVCRALEFKEEEGRLLNGWRRAGVSPSLIARRRRVARRGRRVAYDRVRAVTLPERDVRADDADRTTRGSRAPAPAQPTAPTRDVASSRARRASPPPAAARKRPDEGANEIGGVGTANDTAHLSQESLVRETRMECDDDERATMTGRMNNADVAKMTNADDAARRVPPSVREGSDVLTRARSVIADGESETTAGMKNDRRRAPHAMRRRFM